MNPYCSRFAPIGAALMLLIGSSAFAQTPIDTVIYTTQGEVLLRLEAAVTPKAREIGLMKRDSLKPMDGMLFLFPRADDYSFWMKDTLIPLDILFVDEGHTIVHVEHNVPPYSLAARRCNRKVNAVIELDGGRAAREGIAVGDNVRYELPEHIELR